MLALPKKPCIPADIFPFAPWPGLVTHTLMHGGTHRALRGHSLGMGRECISTKGLPTG